MDINSYWTLIGTTAPIIALAAVVTFSDPSELLDTFDQHYEPNDLNRTAIHGAKLTVAAIFSSGFNLIIQATALGQALLSISHDKNMVPPIVAAGELGLGFSLLLASNSLNVFAGGVKKKLDAVNRQRTPTEQTTEAIATTLHSWAAAQAQPDLHAHRLRRIRARRSR